MKKRFAYIPVFIICFHYPIIQSNENLNNKIEQINKKIALLERERSNIGSFTLFLCAITAIAAAAIGITVDLSALHITKPIVLLGAFASYSSIGFNFFTAKFSIKARERILLAKKQQYESNNLQHTEEKSELPAISVDHEDSHMG